MLDSYPSTFAFMQIHVVDTYTMDWGLARADYYTIEYTPTVWFDGLLTYVGASASTYQNFYNTRRAIPSDIEMHVGAVEISPPTTPPTYEVQVSLSLEPTGTAKTVRVYTAQVLDHYPTTPSYSRNCFRGATSTQDVDLRPGESVVVTKALQIDAVSAATPANMSLYAWAQAPNASGPAEIYQVAMMDYPFEAVYKIKISLPDGVPEFIPPDTPTTLRVRIQNGTERLVPGSAMLHYRYGAGEFMVAPLAATGGEYFAATLPAPGCGAEPEFCFSAQSDGGTTVIYPEDAPTDVLRTIVTRMSTLLDDDFEADLGWTVYNTPGLVNGAWQRVVPAGFPSPDRSPARDYDGSGKCYVTDNRQNQDVDLGPTLLISPIFDLSAGSDVFIRYARWINCDDAATPPYTGQDFLDLELSADGGATWVQAKHVTGTGGWVYDQVRVLDYVALTSQFQFRFSLADNPNNSQTEGGVDDVWMFDLSCPTAEYARGDLNCDGALNTFDIDPFVLALTSPERYATTYPNCDSMLADANCDGAVNTFDIDPFVVCLTGGECPPCR